MEAGIFKGIYTIAAQWQLYEFLPTARAVVEDFLWIFEGQRGCHANNKPFDFDADHDPDPQEFLTEFLPLRDRRNYKNKAGSATLSPLSVWPHLFRGAGHEKKEGRTVEVDPGI